MKWFLETTRRSDEKPLKPPVEIGQRFKYLGVQMVCTRHWIFELNVPVVVADYVDKHGVLREAKFNPIDFDALKAELSCEKKRLEDRVSSRVKIFRKYRRTS